jgi:hypothetical protein
MESFSIGKPSHKEAFKQDIVANIKKRTNNFTTNIYIDTLLQEAIVYSCDICLEFERKAGFLPIDWIQHISSEVCDVFSELFHEFIISSRNEVMKKVLTFMDMAKTAEGKKAIQEVISEFYHR